MEQLDDVMLELVVGICFPLPYQMAWHVSCWSEMSFGSAQACANRVWADVLSNEKSPRDKDAFQRLMHDALQLEKRLRKLITVQAPERGNIKLKQHADSVISGL